MSCTDDTVGAHEKPRRIIGVIDAFPDIPFVLTDDRKRNACTLKQRALRISRLTSKREAVVWIALVGGGPCFSLHGVNTS